MMKGEKDLKWEEPIWERDQIKRNKWNVKPITKSNRDPLDQESGF
jgi:hypothetical protein